jgi:urease accessory protein
MVDHTATSMRMLRLCQLVSPALPIGAYNFSQGLEFAVHKDWARDEQSALQWISGIARHAVSTLDVPLLLRMFDAWQTHDEVKVRRYSAMLLASRESDELRAEERHLGRSLAKVLVSLDIAVAATWTRDVDASYACLFAMAAQHWQIERRIVASAYLWTWCENQVMAALKLLPLGQTAGQRMLNALLLQIESMVEVAMSLEEDEFGIAAPMQGMASAWHETQYTRLFRS